MCQWPNMDRACPVDPQGPQQAGEGTVGAARMERLDHEAWQGHPGATKVS
jgi:hypothetical protein